MKPPNSKPNQPKKKIKIGDVWVASCSAQPGSWYHFHIVACARAWGKNQWLGLKDFPIEIDGWGAQAFWFDDSGLSYSHADLQFKLNRKSRAKPEYYHLYLQ